MIRFILNSCRILILILWFAVVVGANYGLWSISDIPFGLLLIFTTIVNGFLIFLLAVPIPFIFKDIERYRDSLSPKKEKPVKKGKPTQEDLFLSRQH